MPDASAEKSLKQELTELYDAFTTAVVEKDVAWFQENLADDFGCYLVPMGSLATKQEYITNVLGVAEAWIEMGEVEVLQRGDLATVHHTARLFEALPDIDTLDEETRAVRLRMGTDSMIDELAARGEHYYTATWRRSNGRWQCVLHVYVGPIS